MGMYILNVSTCNNRFLEACCSIQKQSFFVFTNSAKNPKLKVFLRTSFICQPELSGSCIFGA